MKDNEPKDTPGIISELNINLKPSQFTVEGIAEKMGIAKKILYEWVKTDSEFSEALEILNVVQREDPFATGTIEDSQINAMTLTLLLLETKDRHYKPRNN